MPLSTFYVLYLDRRVLINMQSTYRKKILSTVGWQLTHMLLLGLLLQCKTLYPVFINEQLSIHYSYRYTYDPFLLYLRNFEPESPAPLSPTAKEEIKSFSIFVVP